MTNTWQDIKNANVVMVMGGNAAEAHPCGFKWVIEAKIENKRQARGGRSALYPYRLGRRLLRTDPSRHGHRLPERRHPLSAGEERHPARIRPRLHQRRADREGGLRLPGRTVQRLRRRKTRLRPVELGLRARRRRLRQGRSTRWQHPRCVINLLREHVARYTPEMVSRICGTPQDKFLAGLRTDRLHRGAGQGADQPVCAGLDAAFRRQRRTSAPWR